MPDPKAHILNYYAISVIMFGRKEYSRTLNFVRFYEDRVKGKEDEF